MTKKIVNIGMVLISLLIILVRNAQGQSAAEMATLQGVDIHDQAAVWNRIAQTSDEQTKLVLVPNSSSSCIMQGSINSGSGIGVAVIWFDSDNAISYTLSRAGISFNYEGLKRTHSEISGACWSASYTLVGKYTDGSTCTAVSMGNPPHSACTDTAIANSSAPVHAATYSDQIAPAAITAVFASDITVHTLTASSLPLPLILGEVSAYVFLNTPLQQQIGLFYVSPTQVNALLPANLPFGGLCTLQLVNLAQDSLRPGFFQSNKVQPGIFTLAGNPNGMAAGYYLDDYVILFGTGFNTASNGYLQVSGQQFSAQYMGITGDGIPFEGLTQLNIHIPGISHNIQTAFCAGTGTDFRCSQLFTLP